MTNSRSQVGGSNRSGSSRQWTTVTCWRSSASSTCGALHGHRAPHKPLLALWAIGRCLRGEPRMAPYSELAEPLGDLLREFGPPRKAVHPQLPVLASAVQMVSGHWTARRRSRSRRAATPTRAHFASTTSTADSPRRSTTRFTRTPGWRLQVARSLLDAHFPWTRHREILRAVGIEADLVESRRRRRDSAFRGRVLEAYVYRCAVCGFAVRLGDRPVAIDAAHIRWHQAHGPATISNGIALCSLHHELFDAGTFTLAGESLQPSHLKYSRPRRTTAPFQRVAEGAPATGSIPRPVVVVAPLVTGEGADEALGRYDGMPVHVPADHVTCGRPRLT